MQYRFLRFPEGRAKAVTFSYDDGCKEDPKFAKILADYGIKCTFNINGDEFRGERAFSKEKLNEYFLSKGHEVAIHGYHHKAPGALRPADGIREVLENRIELECKLGMIIRGMAYPDSGITRMHPGADYDDIKSYLTQLDIAYCRTLGGDNERFELPTDWHAWMPTAHHDNPKIMGFIKSFLDLDPDSARSASRFPRLFYLWGHAFEFARKDNWDHLDEICKQLAGHDDIWYATNIEIYDYVTAYNSLVFSADSSMIYNPTLVKIWLDIGGESYTVHPGQTITVK